MSRNNIARLFIAGLLLYTTVTKAEQLFFDEPLVWDLTLDYDGRWSDYESDNGARSDANSARYSEKLSMSKRFHLLDPKLSTFSISLRPYLIQSKSKDANDNVSETSSRATDYNLNTSLLHGARVPFSFAASANRASGYTDSELGGQSEYENENRSVNLNLKNILLPTRLYLQKREHDKTTTSALTGDQFQYHYKYEQTGLAARRSNLNLNMETTEYQDLVATDRQYSSDRALLNHQARWGKGSYLQSYGNTVRQTGLSAHEIDTVRETLHVQHTQSFSSNATYHYNKFGLTSFTSLEQGTVDFSYKLYNALHASAGYLSKVTEYDTGEEISKGPHYSLSYMKKLPWPKSNFSISYNGSRVDSDRQAVSQTLSIIDEVHDTDITGVVTLNNPYIDNTTVVVTDSVGNPYTLGVHYLVITSFSYTEIQVIDTILIPPGTSLYVDYDYDTPPAMAYRTVTSGTAFNLNIENFMLFYNLNESSQDLLTPGNSAFLVDSETSIYGVSYHLVYQNITGSLGYNQRHNQMGDYETESRMWKQSLNAKLTSLIHINQSLGTGVSKTSSTEVSSLDATIAANFYVPQSALKINTHMKYWEREDIAGNETDIFAHGVAVDWRYHLISIRAALTMSEWNGPDRSSDETRLMLSFTRRSH